MHSQPTQMLVLIIQATLLSLCLPGFFCHNDQQYATCIEPFHCASLRNLSYPFYGGSRPESCGRPGFQFQLNCEDDVPLLYVPYLSYRVLEINFSTYTLKVAREDLWNHICPDNFFDTTLDGFFEIPPDSTDRDVTLYYDCFSDNPRQQNRLLNQFSCGGDIINLFNTGDASSGPGNNMTCSLNISVPVNQTAAQALETPTASSINVLQSALASGFSIKWSADDTICEGCRRSGGACIYNETMEKTVCYKQSQAQGPGAPGPKGGGNGSFPVPPASAPSAPGLPFSGSSVRVGIIIGVILGIVGIIILTTVIVCYLKGPCLPDHSERVSNQDIEKFLLQHGSLAPKRYKYSEIKKMTKSFKDKLGQGGYGSVYKGMLPNGCLVAVKVLTETTRNGEELVNEIASISRTSHVNIVNLLGFCYDGNKRSLVYEFMPNKSLDKFISNSGSPNEGCHLNLNKLYNIAFGVAKGPKYLHTGCSTRIVHFDIKPQNILLDEDFRPKISDFGLAKLCKKKQSMLSLLGARGTIGYIAPEIFSRNYGRVSYKSDVYSYGMMVLEMAGENQIVETEAIQSSENYFPDKIYELVTRDVTRELDDFVVEEEEDLARKMFLVGFWCIQTDPSDRPSMSKVVEMLEGSLQSIPIPPKPVLFTPTAAGQKFSQSLSAYTETENSTEVIVDG